MANAVLRRVSELGEDAHEPQMYRGAMTSLSRHLAHFYSCPEWMVELWLDAYGEDKARAYLEAQVQAPPVGLRVNLAKPEALALRGELLAEEHVLALPTGLAVAPGGHNLGEDMDAGLISRQSAAAQQVMLELGCADWPEPVWDACAGRGGKSCLLAENGKAVHASDLHTGRLAGLVRDAGRLGLSIPAFAARADAPAPLRHAPGTVLLDAPCSGFGVISRRPDIKHKRRPEHLPGLVALQARMLDNAASTLRPGGLVVYITCTLNPAENEEQVHNILAREPGLSLEKTWITPPDSPLHEFFYGAVLRKA
jgi:16S rRNA (cytosine967-C5)-methyltransferase